MASGKITSGENILLDRFPFGSSPKIQPVEPETLRDHLMLNHRADDKLIFGVSGYLPAATDEVEKRGCVALIRQRRRQYIGYEENPVSGKSFALINGPHLTTTAVKYLDSNEVIQDYPASSYRISNGDIYFKANPPTLAYGPNTIWVDYEAGFGDAPSAVDGAWQHVVMVLAFRMYELRGESPGDNVDAWERMIERMVVNAGGSRRG